MTYPLTVPAFVGQNIQRLGPGQFPNYKNAKGLVRYLVAANKTEIQNVKDNLLMPPAVILQVQLGWSPENIVSDLKQEEDKVLALFSGTKGLQVSLGDEWRIIGPTYYLVVSIVAKE